MYVYIYIYKNICIDFPLYYNGHKILAYPFIYKIYRQKLHIYVTLNSVVTNSSIFLMA